MLLLHYINKRVEKIFPIMQKHPGQKLGCLKTPLPSELSSRLVSAPGTSPPAGWIDGETNGNTVEDCFLSVAKVRKISETSKIILIFIIRESLILEKGETPYFFLFLGPINLSPFKCIM